MLLLRPPPQSAEGTLTAARISAAFHSGHASRLGKPYTRPAGREPPPPPPLMRTKSVAQRQETSWGFSTDGSTSSGPASMSRSSLCIDTSVPSAVSSLRAFGSIRISGGPVQRTKLLPDLPDPRLGCLFRLETGNPHAEPHDRQSPSGPLPRHIVSRRPRVPVAPLFHPASSRAEGAKSAAPTIVSQRVENNDLRPAWYVYLPVDPLQIMPRAGQIGRPGGHRGHCEQGQRTAIDQLRVALSRATETLAFVDVAGDEDAHALSADLFDDAAPYHADDLVEHLDAVDRDDHWEPRACDLPLNLLLIAGWQVVDLRRAAIDSLVRRMLRPHRAVAGHEAPVRRVRRADAPRCTRPARVAEHHT
ncbi:MAG: hypothetical protein F4X11_00660 [Acidobacteria bacterium]|nr:hypothetical protein [Acidobacteriota bacterium]